MYMPLYSDSQLRQFRENCRKTVEDTREPLHPDYGDRVIRELAKAHARQINQELRDRRGRKR